MVELGSTVVAIELAVGAQAVELRGQRAGAGTARAVAAVRRHVPFLSMDVQVPDVRGLAGAVRAGEITRAAFGGDGGGDDGGGGGAIDAGSRGIGDVDGA
jgi:hypothetical protein